ncbi:MAG TPA: hypothetical protein VEW71_08385 [Allosphingosinicella sp.]|nr:hypothetical protein [Allosphingosinicella sp.]
MPTRHDHGLLPALRRLAETIRLGLCKQNELDFSAPWNPRSPRCG